MSFNQVTTNIELYTILKKLYTGYKINITPIESLNSIKHHKKQIIIVNMHKPGYKSRVGHWVLIVNKGNDECIYFDSFGVVPPEKILKFMRGYKELGLIDKMIMNKKEIQKMSEDACGWYCLLFLKNYILNDKKVDSAIREINFARTKKYGQELTKKYLK